MIDFEEYRRVIRETMLEVALESDASVLGQSEAKLREFLDANTAITDDEKARVYAQFLQNTVTAAVTQAIQAAVQLPLNAKQVEVLERETLIKEAMKESDLAVNAKKIEVMDGELAIKRAQSDKDLAIKDSEIGVNAQKVASMQAEDVARKNEVAAKVAKAKVEIEQLVPSQVALNTKQLEIEGQRLLVMQKQVESEEKRLLLTDKEIALKDQQVAVEQTRVGLMEADIAIKEKQVEIEGAKLPLVQAQTNAENARNTLMTTQALVEQERMSQIAAETAYRNAQTGAIDKAFEVNERIEDKRNETKIEVATIQATAL